jgi:FkbM family methyltransferase
VLTERLDLLVLAENVLWDAYRTSSLDAPRCVIDVGAGFGDVAIMLSTRFPRCRVAACEPSPERFALLRENARRNGLASLELHQAAVGTAGAYCLPAPAAVSPTLARARPLSPTEPAAAGDVRVPGLPLADLVLGPVDLLKIDCEGAEPDVLESLSQAGAAWVSRIALEYHTWVVPDEDRGLASLLERWGFSCERSPGVLDPGIGHLFASRADEAACC